MNNKADKNRLIDVVLLEYRHTVVSNSMTASRSHSLCQHNNECSDRRTETSPRLSHSHSPTLTVPFCSVAVPVLRSVVSTTTHSHSRRSPARSTRQAPNHLTLHSHIAVYSSRFAHSPHTTPSHSTPTYLHHCTRFNCSLYSVSCHHVQLQSPAAEAITSTSLTPLSAVSRQLLARTHSTCAVGVNSCRHTPTQCTPTASSPMYCTRRRYQTPQNSSTLTRRPLANHSPHCPPTHHSYSHLPPRLNRHPRLPPRCHHCPTICHCWRTAVLAVRPPVPTANCHSPYKKRTAHYYCTAHTVTMPATCRLSASSHPLPHIVD